MTYTTKDAYSDAYGDALNVFIGEALGKVPELVSACCAGQYRDDVQALIESDDALVTDFLREALARLDSERQNRPSARPLKGEES